MTYGFQRIALLHYKMQLHYILHYFIAFTLHNSFISKAKELDIEVTKVIIHGAKNTIKTE